MEGHGRPAEGHGRPRKAAPLLRHPPQLEGRDHFQAKKAVGSSRKVAGSSQKATEALGRPWKLLEGRGKRSEGRGSSQKAVTASDGGAHVSMTMLVSRTQKTLGNRK